MDGTHGGTKSMTEYYKEKFEQGLCFQDYIAEWLYNEGISINPYTSQKYQNEIGENKAGIEIKNDENFRKTGNLYIELAEKSNPDNNEYIKSGIYRNDNTWLYLIGDKYTVYILSKKQMLLLHQSNKYREVKTPTSIGMLLPVNDAVKYYAIKILNRSPDISDSCS